MTKSEFIRDYINVKYKSMRDLKDVEESELDTRYLECVDDYEFAVGEVIDIVLEDARDAYDIDDLRDIQEYIEDMTQVLEESDWFEYEDGLRPAESYDYYANLILENATFDPEDDDCENDIIAVSNEVILI